jgi:hypothetical protein
VTKLNYFFIKEIENSVIIVYLKFDNISHFNLFDGGNEIEIYFLEISLDSLEKNKSFTTSINLA